MQISGTDLMRRVGISPTPSESSHQNSEAVSTGFGYLLFPVGAAALVFLLAGCAATVERMDAAGTVVQRIRVPWPQEWSAESDTIRPGDGTVEAAGCAFEAAIKLAPEVAEKIVNTLAAKAVEAQQGQASKP